MDRVFEKKKTSRKSRDERESKDPYRDRDRDRDHKYRSRGDRSRECDKYREEKQSSKDDEGSKDRVSISRHSRDDKHRDTDRNRSKDYSHDHESKRERSHEPRDGREGNTKRIRVLDGAKEEREERMGFDDKDVEEFGDRTKQEDLRVVEEENQVILEKMEKKPVVDEQFNDNDSFFPSNGSGSIANQHAHPEGEEPDQLTIWTITHTKRDGTPVDATSVEVMRQVDDIMTQCPENSASSTARNEIFTQVMGLDTHGRVRTFGHRVTPTEMRVAGATAEQLRRMSHVIEAREIAYEARQTALMAMIESQGALISSLQGKVSRMQGQMDSLGWNVNNMPTYSGYVTDATQPPEATQH